MPGVSPRVVTYRVASIDLPPTLLAMVAPGEKRMFHGRSLLPLMMGRCEALPPRPLVASSAFADAYALLDGDGRWKLWHNRGDGYEALYDLENDPMETNNVAAAHADLAASLQSKLASSLDRSKSSPDNARKPTS